MKIGNNILLNKEKTLQGASASIGLFLWPRNTIKWIINHDPNYGVMLIAMLSGCTAALRSSALHGLHPVPDLVGIHPLLNDIIAYGIGASASVPMTLAAMFLYGALIGVFFITMGSLTIMSVGWIFGGLGRFQQVRAGLAWAFVPYTWLFPIWGLYSIFSASSLRSTSFAFGTYFPWELSGSLSVLLILDYALRFFCIIWLILKMSVVFKTSLLRTTLIVLISFLPPALLLIPLQRLSF